MMKAKMMDMKLSVEQNLPLKILLFKNNKI